MGEVMAKCRKCGRSDRRIAEVLSACADCIRQGGVEQLSFIDRVHGRYRRNFGLPAAPPRDPGGLLCEICQNRCQIPDGKTGYCGIRANRAGKFSGGTSEGAAVSWYHDPLPTNCVADWVCPGGAGIGYPQWAHSRGPERGYSNLSVFYEACSFDCLFCQNWHYRSSMTQGRRANVNDLVASVLPKTSCICFFGGDPTCQLPHALAAAELARRQNPGRILRICWETNGSMNPALSDQMMSLSLESGGCVKFDLKAFNRNLHRALCGVDNRRTLDNFAAVSGRIKERPVPPPLVASTLLVPGYVDAQEVQAIASFIADLDPNIPYALLAFHGDFLMKDLPPTSRSHAESCLNAAKEAGLSCVRIGNIRTLDDADRTKREG
jgi:pyruvate formate lyase activating enzyme